MPMGLRIQRRASPEDSPGRTRESGSSEPGVSVVLCTRDRSQFAACAVRSILESDYPRFDLVVVDQSRNADTAEALAPFRGDPRLQLHRTETRGVSVARNLGVSLARGDIIAFTDDDCVVDRSWLRQLIEAFGTDPRVGLVFGNVLPAAFDAGGGILPFYIATEPSLVRHVAQYMVDGMGASMGLRRRVWEELRGFDEVLGTGADLRAGEETDFAMRALLGGYFLHVPASAPVVHHGFRPWAVAHALTRGYVHGLAAVLVKLLRCGHWTLVGTLARLAARWAFSRPRNECGFTPPRLGRLEGFLQGCVAGWRLPIDRGSGHFRKAGRARVPSTGA